jgi:PDZ domain-containing protein
MMRRGWTVLVGAVVLLLLSIGLSYLPVPYVALGPGPTVDTLGKSDGKEVIVITGRRTTASEGQLRLTTVSVRDKLDLGSALRYWIDGTTAVVPRDLVYPPDKTDDQVEKQNQQQFKSSQTSAETAALRELGYPVQVFVESLPAGSPSAGKLVKNDVITAVDGQQVTSSQRLIELIRKKKAGETVTLTYQRAGKPSTAKIKTTAAPETKLPVIGVQIDQKQPHPFQIKFELDKIGGPSAGLMFALGIIDKIKPEDLTGGIRIAGTGEIDDEGKVGPIGGIPQKLIAAREAGATVFLTPAANCAEAVRNPPKGLRLVKVTTLDDALTSLEGLRAKRNNVPLCR